MRCVDSRVRRCRVGGGRADRSGGVRAIKVVTTTEDLGLARARGRRRQGVGRRALAKGYQDPHFVDPKPSFILAVSRADLLIVVGRELEIGWLPPLHHQQPQREDPAGRQAAISTRR